MREIKFRGKIATTNSWVYGHYALVKENGQEYPVIYENGRPLIVRWHTVSQFTGLKDKNGKEIYEGDIIKMLFTDDFLISERLSDGTYTNGSEVDDDAIEIYITTVRFRGGCYYIGDCEPDDILSDWNQELEVIGNIFENPELLELEQHHD